MRKSIFLGITILMVLGIMAGCAGNKELVKVMSTSTTQSVFQEIEENVSSAHGYADLRIYSSLKTHKPGFHSVKDIHGTPDYKLLINIDGQAILLRGSLQKENSEPRGLVDPEAGEGIRYRFSKSLRLKAGTHRIVIAIPEHEFALERQITLAEGSKSTLVLEPIYGFTEPRRIPPTYTQAGFLRGINGFRMVLNGKPL